MGALVKLLGFLLILFSLYSLYATFETQIQGEAVKSQLPDFLDFFVDVATPEITDVQIQFGIFYGILFIVGLAMLIRK